MVVIPKQVTIGKFLWMHFGSCNDFFLDKYISCSSVIYRTIFQIIVDLYYKSTWNLNQKKIILMYKHIIPCGVWHDKFIVKKYFYCMFALEMTDTYYLSSESLLFTIRLLFRRVCNAIFKYDFFVNWGGRGR